MNEIQEKFTEKKISAKRLDDMYAVVGDELDVSDKRKHRVHRCGDFLRFKTDADREQWQLEWSNNCRDRFCPRCSFLLSRKYGVRLATSMAYLADQGYRFIFLTLTIPNVAGNELGDAIDGLQQAWRRFVRHKVFKRVCEGVLRKLEVTYNSTKDTYHPHYHCLLVVRKNYFTGKNYVKRDDWLVMWQKSCDDESITQVDVRAIAKDDDGAIQELSKYSAKDCDYLDNGKDVFMAFYHALINRRLMNATGVVKDTFKLYEDGKLDEYRPDKLVEWVYRVFGSWKGAEYEWTEEVINDDADKKLLNDEAADMASYVWHLESAKARVSERNRVVPDLPCNEDECAVAKLLDKSELKRGVIDSYVEKYINEC